MRIIKYIVAIFLILIVIFGYLIYSGSQIVIGDKSPTETFLAKQSLQLLALVGDPRVPHMLASLKVFHSDNKAEQKAGFSFLEKESESGSCYSTGKVGWAYQKGLGVKPNLDIAVSNYVEAAKCGMTYWQIMLAHSYEQGYLGLSVDLEMASFWKDKEPKIHIASYNCWVASFYKDGYFPGNPTKQSEYQTLCEKEGEDF